MKEVRSERAAIGSMPVDSNGGTDDKCEHAKAKMKQENIIKNKIIIKFLDPITSKVEGQSDNCQGNCMQGRKRFTETHVPAQL